MKSILSWLILFVITGFLSPVSGQGYTTLETASRRTQKAYEEALVLRKSNEPVKARMKMEDLMNNDPGFIEAPLILAEWYYAEGMIGETALAFERVMALDSFYRDRNLYSLGRIYLLLGEYSHAAALLQTYLEKGDPDEDLRKRAQSFLEDARFAADLKAHPVPFDPEPIPGEVNTTLHESLPAFTVDGQYMLLTRMVNGQEDIYMSTWDSVAQVWTAPAGLQVVNTRQNEGAHAVSADGSLIVFTACGRSDGAGGCDLYFWRRIDGVSHRPINAGGLNTSGWDAHPAVTPDGRGLYFSSDRAGGMGGRDLWYTERHGERWTKPVNLGAPINTSGDEESPHLFFDGRTMYFMSNGHRGLGDSDLFITRYEDRSWTTPKNLGYPINSHHREGGLAIHPDRKYAYFTSDKKDGQHDLYRFQLDSTFLPPPVSNLQGLVVNAVDETPLVADVIIYDLVDSSELFHYTTDADGRFSAVLVHGPRYGVHVSAEGYLFWSEQFSLEAHEPYQRKHVTIALTPFVSDPGLEFSKPVILRNIEFEFGSASLLPSSMPELNRLLHLLEEHPEMVIEIRGHTDNVGSDEENLALCEARANAVRSWLTEKGVSASRLSARGFGEGSPVSSNDTEEGRQDNRRVEFLVVRKQ